MAKFDLLSEITMSMGGAERDLSELWGQDRWMVGRAISFRAAEIGWTVLKQDNTPPIISDDPDGLDDRTRRLILGAIRASVGQMGQTPPSRLEVYNQALVLARALYPDPEIQTTNRHPRGGFRFAP